MWVSIKNNIKTTYVSTKKCGNRDSGQERVVTWIKNSFAYKPSQ
jgi:hypothetical protein